MSSSVISKAGGILSQYFFCFSFWDTLMPPGNLHSYKSRENPTAPSMYGICFSPVHNRIWEKQKSTTSSSANYGFHYYNELYFRVFTSLPNVSCYWEVSQPLFRGTCVVPRLDHWATALCFSPVKKQQIQLYLAPARLLLQNRALFIHCRVHSILRTEINQQKTYFWILLIPVSFLNFFLKWTPLS